MNRRELLKMIAIATGLPLIGADVVTAAQNATKPAGESHVFSKEDILFLDEVAETIIPRTSTPGAKDAAVGEFMAVYAADCYTGEQRKLFLSAITEIESRSQADHKKAFLGLTGEQRQALLSALDKKAKTEQTPTAPHPFTLVKQLTLLGFFTSKVGATEVLVYDEIPGGFEDRVPYQKGTPAWGTT
ncbi:gluconate 2-dehydrogenase subunit 3 family protein [Rhizobium sp. RM]|uniref:gluconate 2-dehydrogenase subunit 3 family protein n=1 Tax=Rhizobium sp. RM TaxID=2748079 RepID=UPI00110D5209|nr:gluconate 2-dehydrogenase subunit 3 family protein [Rhizobium sp. RM]NWJ25765.1 gluconate 2-dehydrogenase subunit 3 family protein [Rhizobium sp. RM]TMV21679.1 gluconate 2-dehydrogenase subunit 3 family protein [Rhizobium sp. Td3]